MGDKTENQDDFETVVKKLETLVLALESGDLSLEQSLCYYEEGMKLVKLGQEQLNNAEQRIAQLTKEGELEAFPFQG